jgi:hypothetical protein
MTKLLLAGVLLLGACKSHERIAECDHFLETAEKIANCSKLPPEGREMMKGATEAMRRALKQVDDAGGARAGGQEVLDMLSKSCKDQESKLVDLYKSDLGDCLK